MPQYALVLVPNSTLSDFMITQPKIVIPAWIAGIQAPWMVLAYHPWRWIPAPGGYDELVYNLIK
jgi:hypothetical protein